ncbi:hypothetical protein [Sphingomonas sp.]|uniref:hypothetical protein n=1 Tax=Sphingomonas sp. TaxID=28214 RepID=UPI002DD62F63|nr:hypothetical protein [Sphingomonas sp.]
MRDAGDHRGRTVALVLGGFAAGLALPDVDQVLPFLAHRSALTHSLLPALLLLLHPERGRIACGVALGIGVHLAADSFPNAMTGYATVKLPFAGSLGALWSYVWLGANALAALLLGGMMALRALPQPWGRAILAAVAAGSVLYLATTDGGWPVLAIIASLGGIGWYRRRAQ